MVWGRRCWRTAAPKRDWPTDLASFAALVEAWGLVYDELINIKCVNIVSAFVKIYATPITSLRTQTIRLLTRIILT